MTTLLMKKIAEAAKLKRRIDQLTKKLESFKADIREAAKEAGLGPEKENRQVVFDSLEGKCTVVYVDSKVEELKGISLEELFEEGRLDTFVLEGLLWKKPAIRPKAIEFFESLDKGHRTALENVFKVATMDPRVTLPK